MIALLEFATTQQAVYQIDPGSLLQSAVEDEAIAVTK
jgi:hypothetical protein